MVVARVGFTRLFILLMVALLGSASAYASGGECRAIFGRSSWYDQVDFKAVEQTLLHTAVIKLEHLHDALAKEGKQPSGTSLGLRLLTFEDGTKGVWKPGEWQRDGEVGAYQAAKLVGYKLIPPTVARAFDDRSGSIQYFVKTPIDLLPMSRQERHQIWSKVSEKEKSDRDIFNFVFGQWDRHWGNVLIDEAGSIVAIDNGAIRSRQKVQYGNLPFVSRLRFGPSAVKQFAGTDWGPFPFERALLIKPTKESFTEIVGPYVEQAAIDRFWKERADTTMRIVFWENQVWIQPIGFGNYGPIRPTVFPSETIEAYRQLTFEKLRSVLPAQAFSDKQLMEILERRDQILAASVALERAAPTE
jgi:hypothetical protein